MDRPAALDSVAKTPCLVVADSNRTGGLAGVTAATIVERLGNLDAPPPRVTRAGVTVPFAVDLEKGDAAELADDRARVRETEEKS